MTNAVTSTLLLAGVTEVVDALGGFNISQWAIYATGTSSAAIIPDSFEGIEFTGEARVSDYPVEQGGFSSYNKVQVPVQFRIKMNCNGNGAMDKTSFLNELEYMKQTTDLFDVATPEVLYESMNLTHYSYRRDAKNGVQLISVEATFEEIRQTGTASYSSSASPSGADPVNTGTAQTYPYNDIPATPTNPANVGGFQ